MPALYKIAVAIHVLAAVTWVGGVLFMGLVALPIGRRFSPEVRRQITSEIGRRFRTVGWTALGTLVVTGTYMIHMWGATWSNVLNGSFFRTPHTRLLGIKLILVLIMIIVSGAHDWILGPRALRVPVGSDAEARYRKVARYVGEATGLLVIAIVVLAVFVARPWLQV